jgi:hypothetical protein
LQLIKEILPGLLRFWARVLPYVFVGCFLGSFSSRAAFIQRLGFLMRPLARQGNLPEECAAPITLSVAGQMASYSMLAQLNKNGTVNSRQVVVSTLVAALPNGLYNTFFFILPAALASLGLRAGSLYLTVYMSLYLVISIVGIFLGKVMLSKPDCGLIKCQDCEPEKSPWREKLTGAFKSAFPLFGRIALVFMFATFIMTLLLESEIKNVIFAPIDPALIYLGLPAPLILVVTTGMVSTIGALGLIGPLFHSGTINLHEMMVALLLAFILHYLYEFWSHILPTNISIFGGRLGWRVSLATLAAWEMTLVIYLFVAFMVK